jgi:hypothetical protein
MMLAIVLSYIAFIMLRYIQEDFFIYYAKGLNPEPHTC